MNERFPCTVEGCEYVGGTAKARALHVQAKHPMELKPIAAPPPYRALVGAKRAVIYLRVSTIDQSPENQIPAARAFCGMKGFELVTACGHVTDEDTGEIRLGGALYRDHGVSGKNLDRPALKRLIADAAEGRFDVVVFRRLNRLGRSLRDNIALWDYFQSLGVALVSVEEPYDTTTPSGRLIRNVMASVAEYQREEMLEQQREGILRAKAEGRRLGRCPNGCGIPRDLGGLGPCPEKRDHSAYVFDGPEAMQKRAKAAERKRRWRAARQAREEQQRNAGLIAHGTRPVLAGGGLSHGDTAPDGGV